MTALLQAEGLTRRFRGHGRLLRRGPPVLAVNAVDLSVQAREVVGVVGESGCGKSTLGRMLLRLMPPSAGRVVFGGDDLAALSGAALRRARLRMQMVFQDPYGSLDPRRSVGAQVGDGLRIHGLLAGSARQDRVAGLLRQVGLDPALGRRLPHQFSGGQRQRLAIARALATGPDFIVADEPVSALDVSVQAQIVNLLAGLRAELGLAMVFISHDLHVVRHLCDRVVVMYRGHVVEEGPAAAIMQQPAHPYTRALLDATPSMRPRPRAVPAEAPPGAALPGCVFRARCPVAMGRCAEPPPLLPAPSDAGRRVACWRAGEAC